jgi:hypothetical protein
MTTMMKRCMLVKVEILLPLCYGQQIPVVSYALFALPRAIDKGDEDASSTSPDRKLEQAQPVTVDVSPLGWCIVHLVE